ncbi:hypothetical protein B0J12DRAFT_705996 [Macrophomina phaseolina]|uniref:C-type lectin domain-containing protein n=1 Tax=Macrophomina phaseolina TaxID=35725 RepID=A0ABQ8FTA8_9PEZI|nr:hypothetical protein B0J12DRAFT_705996 [Macrophomina phaseolina]
MQAITAFFYLIFLRQVLCQDGSNTGLLAQQQQSCTANICHQVNGFIIERGYTSFASIPKDAYKQITIKDICENLSVDTDPGSPHDGFRVDTVWKELCEDGSAKVLIGITIWRLHDVAWTSWRNGKGGKQGSNNFNPDWSGKLEPSQGDLWHLNCLGKSAVGTRCDQDLCETHVTYRSDYLSRWNDPPSSPIDCRKSTYVTKFNTVLADNLLG